MAVTPVDAPSMETQRGVCLTSAHVICSRFEAEQDARRARWTGPPEGLAAFEARVARRVPRVAPVTLDRPSAVAGPLALLGGSRRLARIALAAAMIGAAALLLAAQFAGGGDGGSVGASPESTMPAAIASPSPALGPASASPSLPATSTPSPSSATSVPPSHPRRRASPPRRVATRSSPGTP